MKSELRFLYGNSSLEGINFCLKENRKKQLKNRMKEKACQQMSFTDWFWKVSSPNGLSVLLARRKKRKNHAACVLVICCLTRVINETKRSVTFGDFLVEDFFLPVIKLPGIYFNNKLLPSCWSSNFSSSFPTTIVLLCAALDPIRPDRNWKSAWRQSVLLFLRQTLHWKLRSWRAATFLIKIVFQPDSFSNNLNRFMLDFM